MADEAAQIVVAVRAGSRPESTSGYQVSARARKGKQNVPNTSVLQVEHEGKKTHNLLETDCKAASHFLRTAIYGEGTYGVEDYNAVRVWTQRFSEHSLHALVILWILAIEKARRRILLNRANFSFGRCFFSNAG